MLDIAVGRLPVTSRQEAQDVVNKLIHYASNPITLGSWKQDIYYLADDGDFNLHQRDADQLATMVDTSQRRIQCTQDLYGCFSTRTNTQWRIG